MDNFEEYSNTILSSESFIKTKTQKTIVLYLISRFLQKNKHNYASDLEIFKTISVILKLIAFYSETKVPENIIIKATQDLLKEEFVSTGPIPVLVLINYLNKKRTSSLLERNADLEKNIAEHFDHQMIVHTIILKIRAYEIDRQTSLLSGKDLFIPRLRQTVTHEKIESRIKIYAPRLISTYFDRESIIEIKGSAGLEVIQHIANLLRLCFETLSKSNYLNTNFYISDSLFSFEELQKIQKSEDKLYDDFTQSSEEQIFKMQEIINQGLSQENQLFVRHSYQNHRGGGFSM